MNARGQISFVDLHDGLAITMYLAANQALTQIYNPDDASYTPNYAASPFLVITPEVYVSGLTGNQILSCGAITWRYAFGANAFAPVPESSTIYTTTDATTGFPQLVIKENMVQGALRVEASTAYIDSNTGVSTTVKAIIAFNKVTNAGQQVVAIMNTPDGRSINQDIRSVRLECNMWRGSDADPTDVEYRWYRRDNQSGTGTDMDWVEITQDISGQIEGCTTGKSITAHTENCIRVYAAAIDNYDVFKCVCKDVDSDSSTYNVEVFDTANINDMTDPYQIVFEAPAGTTFTDGLNSSRVTAYLWQNGEKIESSTFYSNCTFKWTKYTKTGTVDTGWTQTGAVDGVYQGVGTGYQYIDVTRAMVSVATTFALEITIN